MLQWAPVLGWSWKFQEVVFLERNWEKDKKNLGRQLTRLVNYPSPFFVRTLKIEHLAAQLNGFAHSSKGAQCNRINPLSVFQLTMFPEGTRFTPDKHKASMVVAREKGLPELKHHLLPRTRGFVAGLPYLKGKVPAIYDVTVAFPKYDHLKLWQCVVLFMIIG
jgi:lysophosphatidic acid acyltransferase/lysophosphatidylinositol acyltransferase